jgi:histidinol-phosphate aminotransferase
VLLVIDQACAEYVAPDDDDGALALAASAANVLVAHSRIYGLAGERIGWATGDAAIVDMLNRIRGPFNLSLTAGNRAGSGGGPGFVEASRRPMPRSARSSWRRSTRWATTASVRCRARRTSC